LTPARLRAVVTATYLHQPPVVENAMGIQLSALLRQFDATCAAADQLAEAAIAHFERHPDAEIITSFLGLGNLAGARLLAEVGDDRTRFADARGLKAFAGSAPITRASSKKTRMTHRRITNQRLATVGSIWALGSLRSSRGARRHYDARRAAGDWNHQAQRHLFDKFLGQLYHCLHTGQLHNEHLAFPPPLPRCGLIFKLREMSLDVARY
jgi:transposase